MSIGVAGIGSQRQAVIVALMLAVVIIVSVMAVDDGPASARSRSKHYEYAGNPGRTTSTFRNYKHESGRGPSIPGHKPILMSCRVHGPAVADGNTWWYRIAASPWNNRYYVSADAFYNNGRRTGPLTGTPFYDPKVPVC